MITGIIGELGTGKTATATYLAHLAFLKGELIFSNYPLFFEHIKLVHPSHLLFIQKIITNTKIRCKVFLDEVWRWISSFLSQSKIQMILSYAYTRSRKEGWDIIYTTQRFKNVQVRLRSITDALLAPRALPPYAEKPEYFKVSTTDTTGLLNGRPFTFYLDDVIDLFETDTECYGFEDMYESFLDVLHDVSLERFHLGNIDIGEETNEGQGE